MKIPAAFLLLAASAIAADPRGDNPDSKPSTPQEQLAKFHVPPGFEVQLVAAEPRIQKPTNITFDSAGRLWVSGSVEYPWPAGMDAQGKLIPGFEKAYDNIANVFGVKGAPVPSNVARDSVRILSDFGADGLAKSISIFAEGLNIPTGIQPLPRGSVAVAKVFAGAYTPDPNPAEPKPAPAGDQHIQEQPKGDSAIVYSIPNIYLLTDWDGDGVAEKRELLYGTAGYVDTHGGTSSFLYWIDGWIYGTHGFRNHSEITDRAGRVTVLDSGNTYRFRPDGSQFEIYTHGQTNPFGLTVDPLGNFYTADSHSKPVYMLLRGAFYEGIGKQHDGLGFAPRITDDDHGSSAIAGIAYYADDAYPEEFRGNLFNGNPVTQKVNRDKLEWHGSTPKAIRQPDFVTCDDPWFRPIQVKLGPDGALYIADFYNPIIGHYEFPLADPRRDHTHGRIWRVVYVGEKKSEPAALPDLSKLDVNALVEKLADANFIVRTLATNELVDRIGHDAIAPMLEVIGAPDTATTEPGALAPAQPPLSSDAAARRRVHAIWALERLGAGSGDVFESTLHDRDSVVRRFAMKILGERAKWSDAEAATARTALGDSFYFVRRAAADAIGRHPSPDQIEPLLKTWKTSAPEYNQLIHTVRMALRDQFLAPGGAAEATKLAAADSDSAQKLAEVALAAPTSDAASFLLAFLSNTKFQGPRTGEILKHVALNLAPEQFPALLEAVEKVKDAPLDQRLAIVDGLEKASRQRGLKLPDELTVWMQRTMIDALASPDENVLKRALEAVREAKLDAKLDPLVQIIQDRKRNSAIRIAALDAVANLDLGPAALAGALNDTSMTVRKRAAELLGQSVGNRNVSPTLLAALPAAPAELANIIAASLAKNDTSCAALLDAVEAGHASRSLLRNKTVTASLDKRAQTLRDRAATLTKDLPPEDARLDGVIAKRTEEFRTAQPDANHGAQVFAQNCVVCHRFKNTGGNIGPNLDGVAARGVQRLIEDILDPNRNIDPAFAQTLVETTDGQTLAGVGLHEEGKLLTLNDAAGKAVSVPLEKVKSKTQLKLSLMPPTFETTVPGKDFNDLVAFLLSPASAGK